MMDSLKPRQAIVLVDDNDQPLQFKGQTPEERAVWDRKAALYHAYQIGLEAGAGDPWCTAVIKHYAPDPELVAEYTRGFEEAVNKNNKETNVQSK